MDKIQDISTNTQKLNKQIRALGVNVTDDASLADMSTNISLIDASAHPDLELPWVMADGSSGFLIERMASKNRSAVFTGRLVPKYDTEDNYAGNNGLTGIKWSGGACWGIDQMRYNTRMRLRLDKSPGLTADSANNYVGSDSLWSEALNPWWMSNPYTLSHYSNSGYRASQFQPNSSSGMGWTHAASSLAQASSSSYNLTPIGVLNRFNVNSKTEWKMEGLTGCAKKGTILESVRYGLGTYNSEWTYQMTYKPVLRWDVSANKYRPCLKSLYTDSSTYCYSTFPISADMNYDDGSDHMYYYERDKGIEPLEYDYSSGRTYTYSQRMRETDIPYSTDHTYVVRADVGATNSYYDIMFFTNGGLYTTMSGTSRQILITDGGVSYQKATLLNSSTYSSFIVKFKFGSTIDAYFTNANWLGNTQTRLLPFTHVTSSPNTRRDYDRGNIWISIGSTGANQQADYRFYWCYIFDANMNLIHYLVPVLQNNSDYRLYDVITGKIYS